MTHTEFFRNLEQMDNAVKKAAIYLAKHPFKKEVFRLEDQNRDGWLETIRRSFDTDRAESVQFGLALHELQGALKPEFRVNCYDHKFEVEDSFLSINYSECSTEQKMIIAQLIPLALEWFDRIEAEKAFSVLEFANRIEDVLEDLRSKTTSKRLRNSLRFDRWVSM